MPEDSKKAERSSSADVEKTKKESPVVGIAVGLVLVGVLVYLMQHNTHATAYVRVHQGGLGTHVAVRTNPL